MRCNLWERFAVKLENVDEAPEPQRSVMQAVLRPGDSIRLLAFGPAQKILDQVSPATLLAILENEWLWVSGTDAIAPVASRCSFSDTLLVEMSNNLLDGRLRIDFVAEDRAQSVDARFNTVMEGLYQEAVQLLLNGMDGISEITPCNGSDLSRAVKSLPIKFFNVITQFIPMSQRIYALVHWPRVLGRRMKIFWRELVSEAVLVLTDRELLFISEKKAGAWISPKRIQKYGSIVTHCPLSRVKSIELGEHDMLDTVDITVCAGQGREKVKIDFPREQKAEMMDFVAQVTEKRMTVSRKS